MTTGSLGQGASTAAGVAMAHKLNGMPNRTYLILGDGECQEGQVWEMALFAAQRKLSNLTAFVDYNRLQLDGWLDDICSIGDMKAKFDAFEWYTQEVDGHDVEAIYEAIENSKKETERPSMIILHTKKGRGWSEIEDKTNGHCPTVSAEQLQGALAEMQEAYQAIEEG